MKKDDSFRITMNKVYKNLCNHMYDVVPYEKENSLGDMRLIYAYILQAVEDLHTGSIEDQESALAYFKSPRFDYHVELVPAPAELIHKIVYSPEEIKLELSYDVEDDVELFK